ncbi:MAG TPA: thioredoxin-like domain-containing protein [Flavilitoribacter sp.]|nr:thioredoxin-like domain-containing protein [Flavilitoribacter sp.]HMQ88025.1 thioredoxin-like domain-containing protein [Flavilitoribacter sp.]
MTRFFSSVIGLLFFAHLSWAQGYEIKIQISGYEEDELYLAYYYGDKQYIKDTVTIAAEGEKGHFVFAGDEPLAGGVYLAVMKPNNDFFQFVVDEKNQQFELKTDKVNPNDHMKVIGSKDNAAFFQYLQYLEKKRPMAEELKTQLEAAKDDEKKSAKLQQQLDDLNKEVSDYQKKVVKDNPGTMTSAIIRANLPIDMPEFKGEGDDLKVQQWRYTQHHYFDNLDLGDPRMLRTPFLFQRLEHYVNKMVVQHPDTIALAIDEVLEPMQKSEETFRYYLIHYLNSFARSKLVGMDAVYVHLVDHYYAKGLASWTDPDQLKKIIDNANTLRPLLIGKIAPDIRLQKRDGTPISLHEVDSEYTVLYFWRYDCGHCKKSTPFMKDFYEKYKDKGVKIIAVCTKYQDEIPGCWEYIDENGIQDWLHTVDPTGRSRYAQIYDIQSTPQIYILDRNKEILTKRIAAEQIEEVMDKIIEMKQREKEAGN